MLQITFRKLLAKKELNKPNVLTSIRYISTLVDIFLLFFGFMPMGNQICFPCNCTLKESTIITKRELHNYAQEVKRAITRISQTVDCC